jgi:peptide/nickel transport system permease protein
MDLEAPITESVSLVEEVESRTPSRLVRVLSWVRRRPTLALGGGLVLLLLLVAIVGPLLTQYDPTVGDIESSLAPPSAAHLLGTDDLGRDMFTRVIYGARVALGVSVSCVLASLIIGSLLGMIAAFVGGVVGAVIMRVLDLVISFPYVVLVIALLAVLGPGLLSVAIAIIVVDWTAYGRIMYGQVLSAKEREYVEACRATGVSPLRIMLRHIIPNVITPSLVYATLDISQVILLMSALSFLGLGVQPPNADWGTMISDGRTYIYDAWWICTFPGLAIMITGTCFALLGDGLADSLDARR